jgi:1,4-dihydroxy-2-naphthoate octaprenyltransferase
MKVWISAARPRTLPLAISGILLGSISLDAQVPFPVLGFSLCLITAICLQVLSNFANDLGDTQNGADQHRSKGPARAVQSGELSYRSMKKAVLLMALVSFFSGCVLLWVMLAMAGRWSDFVVFLTVGILGILAAYLYTAGPKPYGYAGWGDLSVFVFFGMVAVIGTHYLLFHSISLYVILLAIMMGCLSTMVLHLNNMRDFEDDKKAAKFTVAIKLGWRGSRIYFIILFFVAELILIWWVIQDSHALNMLSLLPLFILTPLTLKIAKSKLETELDGDLKKVALSTFFIAVCLFLTSVSK